jgi:hypothetical protein
LPIFTKVSFCPQAFFPEDEEISVSPPCGLLIEIYLFYENWSTETFRKNWVKKWTVWDTYTVTSQEGMTLPRFAPKM